MPTERVPSGGFAVPTPTTELRSRRRADALFKALSTDYLLREQFVTDPAQVLSEYVSGGRLPDETADVANQLVYAVLADPGLRSWLVGYGARQAGEMPSREAMADELATAVAASNDQLVTRALMRSGVEPDAAFVLQADLLRALVAVFGSRTATGTEMSPGTATEMSPGAVFAGTEMSPGTATEMSPGVTATEMSPGAVFAGTEMSPGTATEMSPGVTGTEMSPGGIDVTLPSHIRVTLGALVDHATQLKASGALRSTGFGGR